jgi:AraC-like DNA-binding protein
LRNEYRIPSSQLPRLVAEARDFVEAHFRERIGASDVATHVGVGANYLSLQYRKEIGITPHADIARKRLHLAEDLLRETTKSVTEICFESGHGSFSQFNRLFRACYGVPPAEYRAYLAAVPI